ncbi:hypothetical protein C5B90_04130 [Haloferax sp. Atlit-12N]|nr:hypothetical protein C5B90_04130 [Haloferax sp. Atlit-12N]
MPSLTRLTPFPRIFAVEVVLAVVFLAIGVVPFALFSETGLSAPPGVGWLWGPALFSLIALWVLLVAHALGDGWHLLRRRKIDALDDRESLVNGVFRTVETLSALAAPVVPFVLVDRSSDAPLPPGAAVAIVLFIAAPLCVAAVTVLLHAGWLLWVGGDSSRGLDTGPY